MQKSSASPRSPDSHTDISNLMRNFHTNSQLSDDALFNLSQSSRVPGVGSGTYGTIGSLPIGSEGLLDIRPGFAYGHDDAKTIIEKLMNTRK